MSSITYSTLLLATTLASACATDATDRTSTGGGKADGSTTELTFKADYTQSLTGSLLAGASVDVSYALDRLTECKTESGGRDTYGVTGYAQFDDAAPVAFAVSRLANGKAVAVTAAVEIPASASHVAMWFSINDTSGCIAYDSNENANYRYTIDRHGLGATIVFDAQGNPTQTAAIHAGDQVVVHYAPERLATCAGETAGHPAYGISGGYAVDGGASHTLAVERTEGTELVAADPVFTIPRGRDLALWFSTSDIWGCHDYDSQGGANYHFTIE
ncbi:hypothetical protein BH11MYX1_BH11MYX1_24090 [soil metagenome]